MRRFLLEVLCPGRLGSGRSLDRVISEARCRTSPPAKWFEAVGAARVNARRGDRRAGTRGRCGQRYPRCRAGRRSHTSGDGRDPRRHDCRRVAQAAVLDGQVEGVTRGLFVASKWSWLDAILEAEGLSPDRQDAGLAQRRLRRLAAEAYRLEAEETERRDAAEAYRRGAEETERRDFVAQSPKPAQPRAHRPWRRFMSA